MKNRIYNIYEVVTPGDMSHGPHTQIILCKEHAKKYKQLVKKDPTVYMFKASIFQQRKTDLPCFWCEEPEEFEKLEKEMED